MLTMLYYRPYVYVGSKGGSKWGKNNNDRKRNVKLTFHGCLQL